ncbi:MAG: methyltransferase domain-containing protein [bacterium]
MQFELEIIKFVPPGDGFGIYQGKAVFVPATVPGDTVRVFSLKENKRAISATLQEILIPSPERCDPPCPHYQNCGGCSLMHLTYERQLDLKKQMLIEVLGSNGIEWTPAIVPSPEIFNYRYKIRVRCEDGRLGFSERKSNRIVEIPGCKIVTPVMAETLKQLVSLGRANTEFHLLQSLKTGAVAVSVMEGKELVPLPGFEPSVEEDYGAGPLILHSHGFAQANPFITTAIIRDLQAAARDSDRVCELFCGCGTFSIALAGSVSRLWGYDISPLSIRTAKENFQRQQLDHGDFSAGDLNRLRKLPPADTVVVDPPRKGLGNHVCQLINRSTAGKLIYVSCNPDSLARDIRELTGRGGFTLDDLTGYDMYCHATHLELLAVLSR